MPLVSLPASVPGPASARAPARAAVLAALLATAGCTSPESTRVEAGGPGADTGNRAEVLRMHEGSKPFIGTPDLNPTQAPPLEPAQHARERSLR